MNVNKEDLEELLEKAFEEGYYGYLDLKESVVQAAIAELEEKQPTKKPAPEQLEFDLSDNGVPTLYTGAASGFISGTFADTTGTYAGTTGTYSDATITNTITTYATNTNSTVHNSTGGYITVNSGNSLPNGGYGIPGSGNIVEGEIIQPDDLDHPF